MNSHLCLVINPVVEQFKRIEKLEYFICTSESVFRSLHFENAEKWKRAVESVRTGRAICCHSCASKDNAKSDRPFLFLFSFIHLKSTIFHYIFCISLHCLSLIFRRLRCSFCGLMASTAAGGPRDYDHLFKLLIIGDSGK